jgi:hypothetical protein
VDIEILQGLEDYIRLQLQYSRDVGLLPRKLEESFANLIQISPRKVCLAAEPAQELETLCSLYLEEPRPKALPLAARKRSERALILGHMKDAFTRAGVWALGLEHIAAGKYTKKKNDPVFFDFGYVVGSEVRFFQAVPLKTSTTQAVNLAYRFPGIAGCVLAETHTSAQLTAVLADDIDRTSPDIEFALDAFKENQVHLASATEMPSIAEKAWQDLKRKTSPPGS